MSEWKTLALRDAGVKLIDCDHRTPPASDTGYPYVAIPQVKDGRINVNAARRISPSHLVEWTKKANPTAYDVVLSRRCNPGETAFVEPEMHFALGQNLVLLRANGDVIYPPFLRWLVRGPEWWEQVGQFINVGAVFESLKCADIPKFELSVPPKLEQREIAHILGTLDDKIELNRRMNETLEAMARAIFQSWFVDFDPVRAKASGESADSICQRLGLTPELLALFPDSFEDSELGEIPKGWAVTTLQSMTSKIGSGATPRGGRDVYLDEGVALIRSQNVYDSQFVWAGLARITDEAAKQLSGVEVQLEDVLINITGASILRTCVVEPEVLPARVNQHVAIIRAKAKSASRYIHLHLMSADMKAYLMGLNAGASREAVTKGHLESVPIIHPGTSLLERFSETVTSLYAQVEQLATQGRALQNLRDALLPKLLSGEISTDGRLTR